jgi:hypothetical protein
LEQRSVVTAILRAFFGSEQDILEPSFIERVTNDLLQDLQGRNYLIVSALTRLNQAQVVSHHNEPQATAEIAEPLRGYLSARISEQHRLTLELFLPKLAPAIEERCAAFLRHQFYTPRLWGCAAPISISVFLRGDNIPLVFQDALLLSDDTPILVDLPSGLAANEERALLTRSVSWKFPKLLIDEGNGYYIERGEAVVFQGEQALLLTTEADKVEAAGITSLEQNAFPELRALLIDTNVSAAANWCRMRSLLAARRRSAQLVAGAPQLSPRQRQLTFVPNDQLYFALMPVDGAPLEWGSDEVTAQGDELLCCSTGVASASLPLWIDEGGRRAELARYELQARPRPPVRPICWVELQGELTTEALLSGSLNLFIRALRPLDHARLCLSLYIGGARRPCATTCIDVYGLPCTLSDPSLVWAELLDGLSLRGIEDHLRLEVRLGALWFGEFLFEAANWDFWWEMEGGAPVLRDEDESQLTMYQSTASALLAPLRPVTRGKAQEGIFLFTAARDGQPLLYGGLCLNLGRNILESRRQIIEEIERFTARIRRKLNSDEGGVGLYELASAYLRWRGASSHRPSEGIDMFAESVRRCAASHLHRLLVEALCGHQWAQIEAARQRLDAQQLFVDLCLEHNLFSLNQTSASRRSLYRELIAMALCERLDYLSAKNHNMIKQVDDPTSEGDVKQDQRDAQFRALVPLIRSGGIGWGGDEDHYEMLDELLYDVLQECSWRYSIMGDLDAARALDELDPGNTGEDWEVLFRRMRLRLSRHRSHDELRHLLQPASGFSELSELPYEGLAHEQLIRELGLWRQRHSAALHGRRWEDEEIEQITMIWLDPERAARTAHLSERALADRAMARAIRYAVLRYLDVNTG